MPKITTKDVAFTLQTIAHLNHEPAVHPYVGHLLLAAELVKMATDNQLAEAMDRVIESHPSNQRESTPRTADNNLASPDIEDMLNQYENELTTHKRTKGTTRFQQGVASHMQEAIVEIRKRLRALVSEQR